jgi:hypothetical protein
MFAPGTGATNPAGWQAAFLPQLSLALGNRVTMQTGDTSHELDAATPDLQSEQTGKQSTHPFVRNGKQAVDRPMLAHHRPPTLPSAD